METRGKIGAIRYLEETRHREGMRRPTKAVAALSPSSNRTRFRKSLTNDLSRDELVPPHSGGVSESDSSCGHGEMARGG